MSDLTKYFSEYKSDEGKPIYKNISFAHVYEDLLAKYRGKEVTFAEIGVGYGGCLQIWRSYFGAKAMIYGIDKEERLGYEEERIKFILANQEDRESLKKAAQIISKLDVLVDDGSHFVSDQINSFEMLFPIIIPGGLYICEDTHTSYRALYHGGYKKEGSFIEYCKGLVDSMYHTEDQNIPINDFCNIIEYVNFYGSMVVIKKTG